jgi:translation initiation factor IF-1
LEIQTVSLQRFQQAKQAEAVAHAVAHAASHVKLFRDPLLGSSASMPNVKGGKAYKKGKNGGSENYVAPYLDRLEGQQVARALRLLGNRNVLCYCNDNRLRICHICGAMRGNRPGNRIEAGDMVLISLRDLRSAKEALAGVDGGARGDIIGRYDPAHYTILRADPEVNEKLFMKLETMDGMTLGEIGVDKSKDSRIRDETDDFGFEFEKTDEQLEAEAREHASRREETNEILNTGGSVRVGNGRRGARQLAATIATADEITDEMINDI